MRPERGEQRDAGHRRRQHERQLDQRDHDRAPAEATRGEQVRRRASRRATMIAIAIGVVSRLSRSASVATGSPRLEISCAAPCA